MWWRGRGSVVAGTSYQDAYTCVDCGGTPLFVKWVAERMARGFAGSHVVACPHHKGWHVQIAEAADPQVADGRLVHVPLRAYRS